MRKLTLPLLVIAGSLKRLCVFLDKRGFSSQLLQHLFHPSSDGQTKFQSIQIALVWSWSQEKGNLNWSGEHVMKMEPLWNLV